MKNYREIVIKALPSVVMLDNKSVSDDERLSAQRLNFNDIFPESLDN